MAIAATQLQRLEGHAGALYALAAGRTNELLFSAGADRVVAEWSLQDGTSQPFAIRTESTVYSLCHLSNRSLLLIGRSDGGLHVIDLAERKEVKYFTLHTGGIFSLLPLPGGKAFVAASADGTISVWDADQLALLRQLPLTQDKLRSLALSQDGKYLAVGGTDAVIHIIDTEHWQPIARLAGHETSVTSLAFHPNGKWLVSGGKDAHLRFWLVAEDFRLVRSIAAHNFGIYSIAFNATGTVCATASRDKTIKLWDPATFDQPLRLDIRTHKGHKNSVNALLWRSNETLISASDDRSIIAWNITA